MTLVIWDQRPYFPFRTQVIIEPVLRTDLGDTKGYRTREERPQMNISHPLTADEADTPALAS